MATNLIEAIHRSASERPTSTAVRGQGGETYSYGELVGRASQLSTLLRECSPAGLREPEARIGICMERSPDMVVAMLGVLEVGGACVLLDPSYPAERLAFMFEDSACQLVITDESTCHLVPPALTSLDIGKALPRTSGGFLVESTPPPRSGMNESCIKGESLAMVLYTSGSSGRPKAAMLTHRNVLALLTARGPLQHSPGDVVAQVLSPSFDAVILDVWGALAHGATVFLTSLECARSVGALLDELDDGVTTLPLTSSMWHQLTQVRSEALTNLRHVWFGGEAVSASSLRPFLKSDLHLVHHYGPTECTSIVTAREISPADADLERVPIGAPLPGVKLYLLDEELNPVVGDAVGELYIGGDQVGRGYLGRPMETATAFLPDPFSEVAGARMYRTGDYARRCADGSFEFRGRRDDQVKVRGYRVELGEVSARLRACPGVSDAVVSLNGSGTGLVAYLVADQANEMLVRSELKRSLPEYMHPARIHFIEELPLLPNGKVDTRHLGESVPDNSRTHEVPEGPPLSPIQRGLAEIWRDLLKVEPSSPDDDFFALGGYSLMMAQLTAKVEERWSIRVPLRDMFRAQTLAEQATLLARLRKDQVVPERERPEETEVKRVPSPDQRRLWFMHQWNPSSVAYSVPMAYRLRGKLDVPALQAAFLEILERNEVLRWAFVDRDGVPEIEVRETAAMKLDLIGVPTSESHVEEELQAFARRPFDLERDPLFRARLFVLEGEFALAVVTHHIVFDGWSAQLFTAELAKLYRSHRAKEPGQLPTPTIQYAHIVARQLAVPEKSKALQQAYWSETLAQVPPALRLPKPESLVTQKRLDRKQGELGNTLLAAAARASMTPFIVGAATYALCLRALLGTPSVLLACPTSSRTSPGSENVIGFLVKTLPILLRVHSEETLNGLLQEARTKSIGAYTNQDLPFDEIARCASCSDPAALARLVFNMVDHRMPPVSLDSVDVTPLELVLDEPRVPVATVISETDNGHSVEIWYDTSEVDAGFVEKLIRSFQRASALMGECPDTTIGQVIGNLQ